MFLASSATVAAGLLNSAYPLPSLPTMLVDSRSSVSSTNTQCNPVSRKYVITFKRKIGKSEREAFKFLTPLPPN